MVRWLSCCVLLSALTAPMLAQSVPRQYRCLFAPTPPTIDGHLDDVAWQGTPWTSSFVNIEGDEHPAAPFETRVMMRWDADHFYFAAKLEETHLWATITERDAVIFYDNDFEIFIDPDGDTHAYYEYEVNALGTVWDLFLTQPYRDGGRYLTSWDIAGLQSAVALQGTLNDPSDTDTGWTVEVAIPWAALREANAGRRVPEAGDQWRVNFSRVQWALDVVDGHYQKTLDPETGKPLHESNWVWSPQGAINMHRPEHWGFVQFEAAATLAEAMPFVESPNERVKRALRTLYYRQVARRKAHGQYADALDMLGDLPTVDGLDFAPVLHTTPSLYEIVAPGFDSTTVHIRQDGRTWIQHHPQP